MPDMFIHTLCEKPADFDGTQVCYGSTKYKGCGVHLYDMKTIKHHQELTRRFRVANGFPFDRSEYSHMKIKRL
jgi:hypothetical protein